MAARSETETVTTSPPVSTEPTPVPGAAAGAVGRAAVRRLDRSAAAPLFQQCLAARPARSLSSEPVIVAAGDADAPHAWWELVALGPETIGVGARSCPTPRWVQPGIDAAWGTARELGYATMVLASEGAELGAAVAGMHTVLTGARWQVQLATTGPASQGHRSADGTWVTGTNPAPATGPVPWSLGPATVGELADMAALDASEYLEPLDAPLIAECIEQRRAVVARHGDTIVGSVLLRPLLGASSRVGEVYNIVTAPALRSHGIGAALLSAAESLAWEHGWDALWLESSMTYATRHKGSPGPFYLRNGWTLLAESGRTVYFAKARPGSDVTLEAVTPTAPTP